VPSRVVFQRVVVADLRNLRELEFEPGPRANVITGDNGQGKTSLLEALYLVATSKSFRTEKLTELIRQGAEVARVRATIDEDGLKREQRVAISEKSRALSLDGKRPSRLAAYATRTPVVVFHPADLRLVSGAAAERRLLLDRVALFVDPASVADRRDYLKALRARQRLLDERGPRARELDAYERVLAEHGARFARARQRAAERCLAALGPAFRRVAPAGLLLEASYAPRGTDDPQTFAREFGERRELDLRRRSASFGPQRDELELGIDGRPARRHASQGQQRILTLALKLAELDCVREARGAHPVLLLDDVSSELDPARSDAVSALLENTESQVFVTTTRPELFRAPSAAIADRRDFALAGGAWTS
jgi:DNA replication and repair protein RecF